MEGMCVIVFNEDNSGNKILKYGTIADCKVFMFDKMFEASDKTWYRDWKTVDCNDGWRFTAKKLKLGNWLDVEYSILPCVNQEEE